MCIDRGMRREGRLTDEPICESTGAENPLIDASFRRKAAQA